MTHIKHFAGSKKQLLVNKAVYRDSIPWVAAMFSIFGVCVCVCVFEAGRMFSHSTLFDLISLG